ncbi:MAG: hypothetical protein A3D95_00320 [Betaproteobacteria bacterium RIFCSPHIGHO2_12_FULL_69_13]|nr:MAG: hypothetical protein A3D95_00320 [Betaproteobacteria bacterium RIFCSPHIGHO2_12_FULL_69_13]
MNDTDRLFDPDFVPPWSSGDEKMPNPAVHVNDFPRENCLRAVAGSRGATSAAMLASDGAAPTRPCNRCAADREAARSA